MRRGGGAAGRRPLGEASGSLLLLNNIFDFPLLVLKGIHHCWKKFLFFYLFFPGALTKWKDPRCGVVFS